MTPPLFLAYSFMKRFGDRYYQNLIWMLTLWRRKFLNEIWTQRPLKVPFPFFIENVGFYLNQKFNVKLKLITLHPVFIPKKAGLIIYYLCRSEIIPDDKCRRPLVMQMHDPKIKFPIVKRCVHYSLFVCCSHS